MSNVFLLLIIISVLGLYFINQNKQEIKNDSIGISHFRQEGEKFQGQKISYMEIDGIVVSGTDKQD